MKKGFTLIELLAVIVILAIIALIATPIVLNIINDTKESAVLRSAEYYIDAVEQSIMRKNMLSGGNFSPNMCEIQTDGNLLCDGREILEVEVDGEKTTSGFITILNGKIANVDLILNKKRIVTNDKGKVIYFPCTLISGDKNTPGSKYECEVKSGTKYNFYVLSHEEDGTTNLIMDRNICEDGTVATENNSCRVAYMAKEDYNDDDVYGEHGRNDKGPVTAINYLNTATSDWSNIPNLNSFYDDEGENFTGFVLNGKARLPYYREIHDNNGCLTYSENGDKYGSCPLWLFCYLNIAEDISINEIGNTAGVYGYWTFSSVSGNFITAWNVSYKGVVGKTYVTDNGMGRGVRPVINIKL